MIDARDPVVVTASLKRCARRRRHGFQIGPWTCASALT
jgi:hypothetical protein